MDNNYKESEFPEDRNYQRDQQNPSDLNSPHSPLGDVHPGTGAAGAAHNGYRSGYNGGYGPISDTYIDKSFRSNPFPGNYGLNYESPNYRQNRNSWDRTRDEVSSWIGNNDAKRRRRVDEIRGKYQGLGPKNCQRSEARIREDIYERLSNDAYVDATNIEVQLAGRDVILTDTVESLEQKRRAMEVVEAVTGVGNVENRIRVESEGARG